MLAARMDLAEGAAEKALPRLRQALIIHPEDAEILILLSLALRQRKQNEEADRLEKQFRQILEQTEQLDQVRRKIQGQPEDVSLRYQAGKLCLEMDQGTEAVHWFQSALWIDPNHRPTHLALADYWKKHGEPRGAAYHLRKAQGKRR
jgi:Tfp pilus assembly protein PilF